MRVTIDGVTLWRTRLSATTTINTLTVQTTDSTIQYTPYTQTHTQTHIQLTLTQVT